MRDILLIKSGLIASFGLCPGSKQPMEASYSDSRGKILDSQLYNQGLDLIGSSNGQ